MFILFFFDLFFPPRARASDPEEFKKSMEFKNQLDRQNQSTPPPQQLAPQPQQQLNLETFDFKPTTKKDLFIVDPKACMRHNPGSRFLHGNGMNNSYYK